MSERLYVGKFTVDAVPKTYTDKFPTNLPTFKTYVPSKAPFKKLFEFPITDVVHGTHGREKRSICKKQDGYARFKANPKMAMTRKLHLLNDVWDWIEEGLLPGRYVWFSMKPTLPEDPEFNKEDYNVFYVNGTSFYGPWSFTFDYRKLISAYKEHIENHSDPDKRNAAVVLRNGGTLMYRREICYVVIVTHSKDATHDNEHYPIIQQYDDVLTTPYCVFHPKCIPPPFVPKGSQPPQNWDGYDFQKLGHYDHIAFAINCDWRGELGEEPGEKPEEEPEEEEPGEEPEEEEPGEEPEEVESVKGPRQEPTPIFKIPLPPGEPHCYFEDCEDDTEKAYCDFHPICLKYGNNQTKRAPSCYSNERKQWLHYEMQKKIKETASKVKDAANEMQKKIEETAKKVKDAANEISLEKNIAAMTVKATEIAEMAKKMVTMVKNTTQDKKTISDLKDVENDIAKIIEDTKSLEIARIAEEMAKMVGDIAELTGHTDSDDKRAKVAVESAQQKVNVAIQKITDIPRVANQIAEKMNVIVKQKKQK